MTPRDELAGWLRSVYIANRDLFGEGADLAGFVRLADEVIAVGWQEPVAEQTREDCGECMGTGACFACSADLP
jgi:hypothetical protein